MSAFTFKRRRAHGLGSIGSKFADDGREKTHWHLENYRFTGVRAAQQWPRKSETFLFGTPAVAVYGTQ